VTVHVAVPVSVLPADMPDAMKSVVAEVGEPMVSVAPSVCDVHAKLHP
jgi:hypothetical protein